MLDLKTFKSALEQLEEERKIPKEKIMDAIEQAMAAAYKKDYGKKGQIIRSKLDLETGKTEFFQVKIVVDESIAKIDTPGEEAKSSETASPDASLEASREKDESDERVHFNGEHHIMFEDAKKIKKGVELNDEIVFPLETKEDYGRIAAQTAKQVIIQKIREAERTSIIDEYGTKEGEVVTGIVQKVERGNVYVDFNRATGILSGEEQIPGEYLERGARIKAYLYSVEDSPRGINLRLSRTHPKFIEKLFEMEALEIQNGIVEIKAISREAGARSKIAVHSNDEHIDPVGSCVGQKGTRVNTVTAELGGEKIDIIPWSEDIKTFITNALSPANVLSLEIDEEDRKATVEVADDQLSLAIGKGGQNVRLAAKLTGWRIDIKGDNTMDDSIEETEMEPGSDPEEGSEKDVKPSEAVSPDASDEESKEKDSSEEEVKEEDSEEEIKSENEEAKSSKAGSPDASDEASREDVEKKDK